MSKTSYSVAVLVVLMAGEVGATIWVGTPSTSGVVQRPAGYQAAVAALARERYDFDAFPPGVNPSGMTDRFLITTVPLSGAVQVVSGMNAGTQPASAPNGVTVFPPTPGTVTSLSLTFPEPVVSAGFVLMGLPVSSHLAAYGPDGSVVMEAGLPMAGAGGRRWVGLMVEGQQIKRLLLEPDGPGSYAFDDLEVGFHAPEPAGMLALVLLGGMVLRRRRRSSPHGCTSGFCPGLAVDSPAGRSGNAPDLRGRRDPHLRPRDPGQALGVGP